jgi:hypothetical protein
MGKETTIPILTRAINLCQYFVTKKKNLCQFLSIGYVLLYRAGPQPHNFCNPKKGHSIF